MKTISLPQKPSSAVIAEIIARCAARTGSTPRDTYFSHRKASHPDHMARMMAWTHLQACGMDKHEIGQAFGRPARAIHDGIRKAYFRNLLKPHEAFMKTLPAVTSEKNQ